MPQRQTRSGADGVFVAATLNPGYADHDGKSRYHDGYYARYGFTLTPSSPPSSEGSPVTLSMMLPAQPSIPPVQVGAVLWSQEAYEEALRKAGFNDISWHEMTVSSEGVDDHGSSFWEPYLARPHAVVIRAR